MLDIWTEKLGLVHSEVILSEIGHLATIPIFWSNQCKNRTNYKTRMVPRDLQKFNYTVLWLYYTACTQKNKKKHTPPKAAATRLTLLLFPMCTKPRARYQNSEPPNRRNRSRFASRSNCTHLKEISPPQYHIYIDNTFRACGNDSPDKKPRERLTDITIRVNQI